MKSKNIENILALTPMQEGMLFHYLKNPQSELYFEQLSLEISGEINVDHFEKAWNTVTASNEMLRTVFHWERLEKPIQISLKEHQCKVIFFDLSDKDNSQKKTVLEEIKNKDLRETFDLHQVPFRVILCKLAERQYEIIISNHHILFDGWSTGIILREFFQAYCESGKGVIFSPPVKPAFKEFVKWIRTQDTVKQEEYWNGYLKGPGPGPDRAVTRKRKKRKELKNTANYKFKFPGELKTKLDVFIKDHNITIASFLYSVWGVLLQNYYSTEDIIFDATVSGRSASARIKGIENIVGLFINTMPMRVKTSANETAADFLSRMYRMVLEWAEFENSSPLQVREILDKCHKESLFDSVVVIENYPLDSLTVRETAPLFLHSFSIVERTFYDLTVIITTLNGIEFNITYNNDLFDPTVISRLSNHLVSIAAEMVTHPGKALSEIEVWMGEEREKLLASIRRAREMEPELEVEIDYIAPRNEVEEKLVEIWSEILNIDRDAMGINHNFFDFGGHSLKASLLVASIHRAFNVKVPLAEIFKWPTIRGLARYIRGTGEERYASILPLEKREYYTTSPAQQRMFALWQMEPESIAYNGPTMMLLKGHVNRKQLNESFQQLIERHESLRTSYGQFNGEPVQRVHDKVEFEIEYYMVAPLDPLPGMAKGRSGSFIRPFDLSTAPLLRVGLVETGPFQYLLMVDMHHIAADGVSADILKREFLRFYKGEELSTLRIQYKDFSSWQNGILRREELKRQEQYWLNSFAGDIPVLDLCTDFPRPTTPSGEGKIFIFRIKKDLREKIAHLEKRSGATLFMILLSAYNVLLMKYTDLEDIIVGTLTNGRNHADLTGIVGVFITTLALRNKMEKGKRFIDFVHEVRENVINAFENSDYQFDELLKKVRLTRNVNRKNLFDTMLLLQNYKRPESEVPVEGLDIKPYPYDKGTSTLDLLLTAVEIEKEIEIEVEYNTQLFKEETIERLSGHYIEILKTVVTNPGRYLKEIEILTEAERNRILYDFNSSAFDFPDVMMVEEFAAVVEKRADQIAIFSPGSSQGVTYRELNDRTNQLARVLRKKGLKADTLVGIMAERSINAIVGLLAVIKAGGAYLPVDPVYPPERIHYMMENANVELLLTRHIQGTPENQVNFKNEIIDLDNGELYSGDTTDLECINKPTDLVYMIYTSGSTGQPKGTMVEHRQYMNAAFAWRKEYNLKDMEVHLLQMAGFSFDVFAGDIARTLLNGGKMVICPDDTRVEPISLYSLIRREWITLFEATPALIIPLMEYIYENKLKIDNLQLLIPGSDVCRREDFKNLFTRFGSRMRIVNSYGVTEATVDTSYFEVHGEDIPGQGNVPIGKPLPNMKFYVLDSDKRLQAVGAVGELYIGGKGVARGYANLVEMTAKRFVNDPFCPGEKMYKTGDLGRWLADGNMEFLGRIDNQVKIRGFRIELGEIEAQLIKYNQIKDAVVISKDDKKIGKYLCAYIVSDREILLPGLRAFLARKLPRHMIPLYIVPLNEIPLNANGKVDRNALPEPIFTGTVGNYIAPRDDMEEKLAEIWQELLGLDKIGINDSFFEIGGQSLMAMRLVSLINTAFNVEIKITDIFRSGTIKEIAEIIKSLRSRINQGAEGENRQRIPTVETLPAPISGENRDEDGVFIKPMPTDAKIPLSFAQERMWFFQQLDPDYIAYNVPRVFRVKGSLEIQLLERTFTEIIRRHEILRTTFPTIDGEPVQQIQEPYPFKIPVIDLSWMEDREQEDYISKWLLEEGQGLFDFEKGPLFRMKALKLKPDEHLITSTEHHLVHDGWAGGVFLNEFITICTAFSQGKPSPLPELPIQYKDFVHWQRNYLRGEVLEKHLEYWKKKLAGMPPLLNLPLDHPRPAVNTGRGNEKDIFLSRELSVELQEFSIKRGVTLFMTMLAVFKVLLYRYTGTGDLCVGSGMANRKFKEMEGMLGMVINTLPLRTMISGEIPFEEYLSRVKTTCLEAYEHEDAPLEEVVNVIKPERSLSYTPLFQVLFSFMDTPVYRLYVPGLELQIEPTNNRSSKFDINIITEPPAAPRLEVSGGRIEVRWEYNTEIFEDETTERMIRHYVRLLEEVVHHPGVCVSNLPMLGIEEIERLLVEWNNTGADYPGDKTVHELLEEQAERTPDNIAVVGTDIGITYRELNEKSNQLANYLLYEKYIQPEDRIGILMDRTVNVNLVAAILGVLKAGGVYVPMDPGLPRQRLKHMIDDAGIEVVISQGKFIWTLNRLQWECPRFHTYLCVDSRDIYGELEKEKSELMDEKLWNYVGETAVDDITGGGWISSYTGEPFSKAEMDEYGDNILTKLTPLLHKNMRVLEIGCASGITMYRIAPKVGFYYGIDLSEAIIRKNMQQVKEQGWQNIKLDCVPAHDIHKIKEKDFDLVILNSVIQCFHGHNYLIKVLKKAVDLLGDNGYLFIGDVMNQEKKDALVRELTVFKEANRHMGYTTKTDFSAELFVSPGFWQDLEDGWNEIETVTCSDKIFSIENELTKFRYDVLIKVSKVRKTGHRKNHKVYREKIKYQDDMRVVFRHGGSWLGPDIHAGHLAYIIYTSGSTGKPKGVPITHINISPLLHWGYRQLGLGPADRTLQNLSYYFDWSVWEIFITLTSGACLVSVPDEILLNPETCIAFMGKMDITVLHATPTQFYYLLCVEHQMKTLKYLFLGAEKLSYDLAKRSFASVSRGCRVFNMYGPTECTIIAATLEFKPSDLKVFEELSVIPIGVPVGNTELLVLDKDMRMCPVNVTGELYIAGDGVAGGYLNNPELTAERFLNHELFEEKRLHLTPNTKHLTLYRTGDLARWLPDGNIEFLGRIDHQVKIRGFRIELGEIESRLLNYPGIKEAVVLVQEEVSDDKSICAYFVSNKENVISELREYLSKDLPDYMIPSYFVQLEKIPLASNGKIDRRMLPKPELKTSESYTAPKDEIETKLIEIWSEILGRDELHSSQLQTSIGIDDNFFQLGGHSLKATILVLKIHKVFDVKIPLTEIFKKPTIRGLSKYIGGNTAAGQYTGIAPVEKKEYYVLSSAQKRLHFLQQMDKEGISYNIPSIHILEGIVDKNKLEQSITKLIRRHESLRTSIEVIEEEPVQRIHEDVKFAIEHYDLSGINEIESSKFKIQNSFVRAFDLPKAPLLRVGLIKLEEKKHIFLVDMHHIIADGMSAQVLVRDFSALYTGKELPEIKLQYKDYAEWQNKEKVSKKILEQGEYWKKEYEGEIPVLELPTDYARPVIQSFEGNRINFKIHSETAGALKALALETGVTLYIVLLALYTILLSKLSRQEDIVIGTTVAGRRHADLEKIIGMFVNTLAFRIYPSGEKGFLEFLEEVKEIALKGFENQECQYEDLVEKVAVTRDVSRNPLFDTIFTLQNTGSQKIELPGLKLVPYENEKKTSKFDLTLAVEEVEDKLHLTFEYCTKLFKRETVERFIVYFKNIVRSIIENKNRRISDLEILTEEEKNRILYEFNDTEAEYTKDKTIHQLFEEQVERTPDHVALTGPKLQNTKYKIQTKYKSQITNNKQSSALRADFDAFGEAGLRAKSQELIAFTYKELNEKSIRLAGLLIEKGVLADSIVGIMMERFVEMIIGILGILKSGGAYLPIDPDYPQERIDYMLKDSGAKLLVTTDHISSPAFSASSAVKNLLPATGHWQPATSLAYIMYTSGTTGGPKGVLVTHKNVVRLVKNTDYVELTKETRILQTGAPVFDATTFEIWGSLLNGGQLVLTEKEVILNTRQLGEALKRFDISTLWLSSPLFNQLSENDAGIFSPLAYLLVGGDVLSPTHINRLKKTFSELAVINGYGPTENTTFSTTYRIRGEFESNIPIGRPIANSTAYIVDRNGHFQPIGVSGELVVGGEGLSRGYLNNPELTAERFISFAHELHEERSYLTTNTNTITNIKHLTLYRTGDLARWLSDGNIEFIGRIDHQVKIRGFRIELGEIENLLLKHPGIKEAVVLARDDAGRQASLCAYIRLIPGQTMPLISQWRDYLSATLPSYMIPASFVQVDVIPLTSNGKINWKALPKPGFEADEEYMPPTDDLQEKLVEIWAEILEINKNKIGINSDFFNLGGHSLTATTLAARIHKELDMEISLREIFTTPTIKGIAALVKIINWTDAKNPGRVANQERDIIEL